MKNVFFFDIDTQKDFMHGNGALYVKGAEKIIGNLKSLIQFAVDHNIPIISSACAHIEKDPEFKTFPPHCIKGTVGQQRIPETLTGDAVVVGNKESNLDFARAIDQHKQIIFEKQVLDVFEGNKNIEKALTHLPKTAVVFGVTTDYCVKYAALGLRKRGFAVKLVTDAIKEVDEAAGRQALEEMKLAGIAMTTTREILKQK